MDKSLPVGDYYDVVIFGYLDSVHRYHTVEKIRQYAFSTVAWKGMNNALSNHRKAQFRRKRHGEVISLSKDNAEQILAKQFISSFSYDPMEDLKIRLLLYDLARMLSLQQMDIVLLRLNGHSIRQIAKRHKTTMKKVQALLKDACIVLNQLCYET